MSLLPPGRLIVTADDTTGALESAAIVADLGWSAVVLSATGALTPAGAPASCVVVDLRSRHEPAGVAADRFSAMLRRYDPVRAHKIDSTLRGNWPAELAAAIAMGRRVLLVPAYPAAGRVCSGGVVTERGISVDLTDHARDPRAPVRTGRPSTLLAGAVELASTAHVAEWLAGQGSVAVADATDDADIAAIVALACRDDVLIAGTAAVVGAVAHCLGEGVHCAVERRPSGVLAGPALVLCGSLHPASRAQIDALLAAGASTSSAGRSQVTVMVSSPERGDDPVQVAAMLARRARELVRSMGVATVLVVGGDTAEAFIGDRSVTVVGSLDVGVALGSLELDGRTITLLAKPGGFGEPNTLVHLMNDLLTGMSTL